MPEEKEITKKTTVIETIVTPRGILKICSDDQKAVEKYIKNKMLELRGKKVSVFLVAEEKEESIFDKASGKDSEE